LEKREKKRKQPLMRNNSLRWKTLLLFAFFFAFFSTPSTSTLAVGITRKTTTQHTSQKSSSVALGEVAF